MDERAEKARSYFSAALDSYLRENPGASVAEVREFTLDLFGTALPNFTDLTETLACELFDEIAEECGFEGERARLYDTTDYQVVEGKVRYFAGFLADDDPERFKREVADITRYFCRRAAFENMVENCRAQKVKWARMPTGFETCPFCFMLSSRGFVYASEKTASEGHHGYHDNCDCVPVPGFQDERGNPRVKIDGYDPETMYRNWTSCEKTIGGREQSRAEWLALPEDEREGYIERHGNAAKAFARFEQNRICNEVATRDWHWLYTGEVPKVGFQNDKLKNDIRENRPHEEDSAGRVAKHGITPILMKDYEEYYDEHGVQQRRGLADMIKGVELKTLGAYEDKPGASTYNTINGYIKRSSNRKKNMRILIFDNSQNDDMEDDDLIAHIRRSRAFGRGRIYILDHEEVYRFIR